ncbi:hypothetical protein Cni_G17046 [Canna indica]|uniref:Uncharacterized protein n=1 Tax=Canna indica TaxID=4628 RepID=A0AAQ3QGE3_9LILI|nr:hypothetical protein Cni_G17046 [Canna indica]
MVHKGQTDVTAAPHAFPSGDDPADLGSLSIPQLVEFLRSSFTDADFQKAESILVSREASLKAAIERSLSEELIVNEVERIELVARIQGLERDLGVLRSQCTDLEHRHKKSEERFGAEMSELGRKLREEKERYSLLETRFQDLDGLNLCLDAEFEKCKRTRDSLEDEIQRLKEACRIASEREHRAQEKITTLLETQKEQADEVDSCSRKCRDLEAKVSQLENENQILRGIGRKSEEDKEIVKACTLPGMEVGSNRKFNLPTKEKGNPVLDGVIEISDGEDESLIKDCQEKENMMKGALNAENESTTHKSCKAFYSDVTRNLVALNDDNSHMDGVLPIPTPKKKRVCRVVTSDNEEEDGDDNMPIAKLLRRSEGVVEEDIESRDIVEDMAPSRRRLVLLRELYRSDSAVKGKSPPNPSTPSAKGTTSRNKATTRRKLDYLDNSDDDDEKEESNGKKDVDDAISDSDGESLGGFIVSESDSPESGSSSENSLSVEEVGSDLDLDNVLADIRRDRGTKTWEYEADMLASFSKDHELCMKAVCALYRQQTSDEQSIKGTLLLNKRGFNKIDAHRGSMIAEFLTDGDPSGPLKKTIQDLKNYDSKALDYCHKFATRYSKQLFSIYQNKEDPFFRPS